MTEAGGASTAPAPPARDDRPPPPLRWEWGRHQLDDLLRTLRDQGFAAGTSETLDAARLLHRLQPPAGADAAPASAAVEAARGATLRRALAPLLCKESDAQRRAQFEQIFDAWWNAGLGSRVVRTPAPLPDLGSMPTVGRGGSQRAWVLVVLLGIAVLVAWWLLSARQQPSVPASGAASSAVPNASAARPGVTRPTTAPTPEPRTAATAPSTAAATAASTPAPASAALDGYQPAFFNVPVLRPWLAWALVLAPLALIALATLALLNALPRLAAGRAGQRVRTIELDGWNRDELARRLVPELDETSVGRLERHVRGTISQWRGVSRRPQIDLRRTVDATMGALGIPQMRYRQALLRPSYRVLVEADDDDAPAMLWAARLCTAGADGTLWRVQSQADGSEPVCHGQGALRGRTQPFGQLAAPAPGERLVLVSDGAFLLHPLRTADPAGAAPAPSGWHEWVRRARLQRWRVRALFTPREWRVARDGVLAELDKPMVADDPGFLVLPQEDAAVDAWTHWLARGRLPVIALADRAAYPRLLLQFDDALWRSEPDTWRQTLHEDERASAARIRQLMAQLHLYLGDNGFYWLCCCAVPPVLRMGLSLQLGENYLQGAGARGEVLQRYLADNYRRLARLPWFSHQQMPQWLRLALLSRLPPAVQAEVRGVVERLLDPQRPVQHGDLKLSFAWPPAMRGSDEQASGPGAAGKPGKPKPEPLRDALYVGFMSGVSAQQLALRLPGSWQRWLGDLNVMQSRRARAWGRLQALLASLLFRDGLLQQGIAPRAWIGLGALAGVSLLAAAVLASSGGAAAVLRAAAFEDTDTRLQMKHDETAVVAERFVSALSFSPDGTRVLSAARSGQARLWDAATGRPLGAAMVHDAAVTSAAFSGDGERVLTTSAKGAVRVWDGHSGLAVSPSQAFSGKLTSAHLNPAGTRVLTTHDDGSSRLLDAATLNLVAQAQAHQGPAFDGAFSPDGRWLATVGADKLLVLQPGDGTAFRVSASTNEAMRRVGFSRDGGRVLTAGGRMAQVCVVYPGASTATKLGSCSVVMAGDGQVPQWMPTLASGTEDVTASAFDADGRQFVAATATGLQWGRVAASGGTSQHATLARVATGGAINPAPIDQLAFSPDGRQFASIDSNGAVRTWAYDDNAKAIVPIGTPLEAGTVPQGSDFAAAAAQLAGGIHAVAFDAGASRLLSAGGDGSIRVWSDATPHQLAPVRELTSASTRSISRSADGHVAVLQGSGQLWLWQQPSGAISELTPPGAVIGQHALSADGTALSAMLVDGSVRAWALAEPARPLVVPVAAAFAASTPAGAFRRLVPDGRSLLVTTAGGVEVAPIAAASAEARVRLPEERGKLTAGLKATATESADANASLAFSRSAPRMALARAGELLIYDLAKGTAVSPSDAPGPAAVRGLWMSDDGSRLALLQGPADQASPWSLQFRETDSGHVQATAALTPKPGGRMARGLTHSLQARFSPGGTRLALGFATEDVVAAPGVGLLLLDARTGAALNAAAPLAAPQGQPAFSGDGRLLAVADTSGLVRLLDTDNGATLAAWNSGTDVGALQFGADECSLLVAGSVTRPLGAGRAAALPQRLAARTSIIDWLPAVASAQAAVAPPPVVQNPAQNATQNATQNAAQDAAQYREQNPAQNPAKRAQPSAEQQKQAQAVAAAVARKAVANAKPGGKAPPAKSPGPAILSSPSPTSPTLSAAVARPTETVVLAQAWRIPDIAALHAARSDIDPEPLALANVALDAHGVALLLSLCGLMLVGGGAAWLARRTRQRLAAEDLAWQRLGRQQREAMAQAVESPRVSALRKASPLPREHAPQSAPTA